jgi:hypothetical protein
MLLLLERLLLFFCLFLFKRKRKGLPVTSDFLSTEVTCHSCRYKIFPDSIRNSHACCSWSTSPTFDRCACLSLFPLLLYCNAVVRFGTMPVVFQGFSTLFGHSFVYFPI